MNKNLKVAKSIPSENLITTITPSFETTVEIATRKKKNFPNAKTEIFKTSIPFTSVAAPQDVEQKISHPAKIHKLISKKSPSPTPPHSSVLASESSSSCPYQEPVLTMSDLQEFRQSLPDQNNHNIKKFRKPSNVAVKQIVSSKENHEKLVNLSMLGVLFATICILTGIFISTKKVSAPPPKLASLVNTETEPASHPQILQQNIIEKTAPPKNDAQVNSSPQSTPPTQKVNEKDEDKIIKKPDGKLVLLPADFKLSTQNPKHHAKYPIDINKATYADLLEINGIGPSLATKIMAGKPYHEVKNLLKIDGIGKATYKKIAAYFIVQN